MLIQKHVVYLQYFIFDYIHLLVMVERNIIVHIHLSIIITFMPKGNKFEADKYPLRGWLSLIELSCF